MDKYSLTTAKRVEDFAPFIKREGLIYVPYYSRDRWRLLAMAPEIVRKGVCNAMPLLADNKVISLAAWALRKERAG